MFNCIKINLSKIFLLFCLLVLCACDNRKGVCIEADDFGFEEIERFDVLSYASPTKEEDHCLYHEEAGSFRSYNTDLNYCLNGAENQDHCEETYDGYVSYQTQYCRFYNNDNVDELDAAEISDNNKNCIQLDKINAVKNKGCNFGSIDGIIHPSIVDTPENQKKMIEDAKQACIASCINKCRQKKACTHVTSRLPIKDGATSITPNHNPDIYNIFNPYNGTFLLKHNLDGNLFVVNGITFRQNTIQNNLYDFIWTDNSSELQELFQKLQNPKNKQKLSLAINLDETPTLASQSILINDFDNCNIDIVSNTFTCQINQDRDLSTKDKIYKLKDRISQPTSFLGNVVAIFDYIKIKEINIQNRTITTETQHHFGTNSFVEIVSAAGAEYKIKVKKINNSLQFIYEDISANIETIKNNCSSFGQKCFLIPSIEQIELEDKFMPPWKATTLKYTPTSTGGLQISAGSKVEIKASGNITLGNSEKKVCYKHNDSNYGVPNLFDANCIDPENFNLNNDTKYQPNVQPKPIDVNSNYNLYRLLTEVEKSQITHSNPDYNNICKNFCYTKIVTQSTSKTSGDFVCDINIPNIKYSNGIQCKYRNVNITETYESEKEQVRISNYAKRVIIDSSQDSYTHTLSNASYTTTPESISFVTDPYKISYTDLKQKISPTPPDDTLLIAYFSFSPDCKFNTTLKKDEDMKQLLDTKLDETTNIIYPGSTLEISRTSKTCNSLTITPYPYIQFTAPQSGFVSFKTNNSCSGLKNIKVINNNLSYPPVSDSSGQNPSSVQSKMLFNIGSAGNFFDVVINKIANKIIHIYDSFATTSAIVVDFNEPGKNAQSSVCNSCFDDILTASDYKEENITCSIIEPFGCGGDTVEPRYLTGELTVFPQDGKSGKVTIKFLDGQELTFSSAGIYHVPINYDRKITKIELIGGGGGASYAIQYESSNQVDKHKGVNAKKFIIEKPNGVILSSIDNITAYKINNQYILKIIVGYGGKNSTEINHYKTFSGFSHRDSYDYSVYKKNFGYAGGSGDSSVIALVNPKNPNFIMPLAIAGGGGAGGGKTCDGLIMMTGGEILENKQILHNADYTYLKEIIQCSTGVLQQNSGVSNVDCNNNLGGLPGYCPGFSDCNVNSGTIPNWQAYKATANVTLLRIDIPTINANIICNTGYVGIPKYTCKTEQGQNNFLALSGCYPKTGFPQSIPSLWLETKDNPFMAFGGTNIPTIGTTISSWKSQSPDALGGSAIEVNQATEANKPVYISNGINSFPALQFDSSDNLSNLNISVDKLLGNLASKNTATLFVVQQVNNTNNSKSFKLSYSDQQFALGAYDGNSLFFDFGVCCNQYSSINTTAFTTQPTILSLKKEGHNLYAYQNSQLLVQSATNIATSTITINPAVSTVLNIASGLNGKIAEVLVYKEALTDPQRVAVENYLKEKWNIASGCSASTLLNANHGGKTVYISGETATCNTGYSSSSAPINPTCNNSSWDASCTANTCTASLTSSTNIFGAGASTSKANAITTGQILPTTISGLSCGTGYSLSSTGSGNALCTNSSTNITVGRCEINTCTAPIIIPTGYTLPSVFTYEYYTGTTAKTITGGASCTAGYKGTPAYKCLADRVGSTIQATLSGCDTNACTAVLKNHDNTSDISSTNVSTGLVDFNNIFDNLSCNSNQTKVKFSTTYPSDSFVCNPEGTAHKLGNCYDKCAVNSGVMTNTAYKNQNSSKIYLDHNSTSNADIICNTGYSGTASYVCNNGTLSGLQGCAVNTCIAPSPTAGYVLPIGFAYNYTGPSNPERITGASCATGYSGTPTYECSANSVGSSTQVILRGCNINRCGTLTNSNYSSFEGVYGNTATCNGSSGYGSSNPGSNPVCQANGTWSANCRWNSCNVNQIAGYVGLPATVPNLNNTNYIYYFSPNVPCAAGYRGGFNNSGVYNCWNTNSDGTNININPRECFP